MFRLRSWIMRINHVPTFHPRFSLTILTTGSTWRVVLSSLMIAITFQENIRLFWTSIILLLLSLTIEFHVFDLLDLLQNLKQFKSAKLSPIEAGCCRPPSEYASNLSLFSSFYCLQVTYALFLQWHFCYCLCFECFQVCLPYCECLVLRPELPPDKFQ